MALAEGLGLLAKVFEGGCCGGCAAHTRGKSRWLDYNIKKRCYGRVWESKSVRISRYFVTQIQWDQENTATLWSWFQNLNFSDHLSYNLTVIILINISQAYLSRMNCMNGNAKQFGPTLLKLISGSIPQEINGNYFRNGSGMSSYGNQYANHWFDGDGAILKLNFGKGDCTAQLKFVETPLRKRRQANQSFSEGVFSMLVNKFRGGSDSGNQANTSVLPLKNSEDLLALCQGGRPFVLKKEDLKSENFNDYGWMTSAFSAHPKVDSDNGDIFNIGMDFPRMRIMRATKNMQKICETSFKLRQLQSIHDFCLAGDYVVVMEHPLRFHLKDMVWNRRFFYSCCTVQDDIPTLVHIYKKANLQLIKTIEIEPFYVFHHTNGYSTDANIVLEYIKYDTKSARNMWKMIEEYPKIKQQDQLLKYQITPVLQQLTIDLTTFKTSSKTTKIPGEFPVCEQSQVGKNWRYTYVVGSNVDKVLHFNTIYKYDRQTEQIYKTTLQGNVNLSEVAIIRTSKAVYLMSVVNRDRRSYVELFDADSLGSVCRLQLPEFVPAGFHGKWDAMQK